MTHQSYYDRKIHGAPLKVGYLVWKALRRVKWGRPWALAPHFLGPYEVVEVLSEVNYRIRLVGKVKTLVEHFII